MSMWNREKETLSRDEYAKVQFEGLKKSLTRVWGNEFYRERLKKGGLGSPEDVKSLDDLSKLPFFTKDDFRDAYPLKMNCVDRKELLEFHMSSGSTGTPVVMAYTKNDLLQWAECMARCYAMAGLEKGDAFQIIPTFGLFNGGFGFYHGARKAGLFTVPASSGNTERQIKLMKDFKSKGFASVVSYVPRLIEKLDECPEGERDLPYLKVGIFGSETFSDETRRRIEKRLGIECFDIYGMTETGGVGTTGQDCKCHCGLHVFEDQYITEIIDPATGELVPDGEYGEIVFTSLTREAMPIIRYRTHDITRILSREKCECGRTSPHREGRQLLSTTGRAGAEGNPRHRGRVPDHSRGAPRNDGRHDQRRSGARRHWPHGGEASQGTSWLPPEGRRLPDRGPAAQRGQGKARHQDQEGLNRHHEPHRVVSS